MKSFLGIITTLLLVSVTLATKTTSAPVSHTNSNLGKSARVTNSFISQFTQCIGDGDCNEGQYCHFRPGVPFGLCQECKDCQQFYYRKPNRNSCAKNSNYCGECLDGYFDELTSDGSKAERCTRNFGTRHYDHTQTTPSGPSRPESSPDILDTVVIIGSVSVAVAFLVLVSCVVYLFHVQKRCFWNDDDGKNDSLDEIQTEEGLLNNNNCLVQVPNNGDDDDNRIIQDPPMMVVATCETGKPNKAGCWQVPVSFETFFIFSFMINFIIVCLH